jgi:hypothetical protein
MDSIVVPPVPLRSINLRIERRRNATKVVTRRRPPLAAAAAVLALVALPAVAYSIASYEAQSRAALWQQGGWAPPPPPPGFLARLHARTVTLTQAKAQVDFTLTVPSGLPSDAVLSRVDIWHVGLYDRTAHIWRVGPTEALFHYRRSGGRSFHAMLSHYEQSEIPGRYLFEDNGPDVHGNPVLVRHQNFAWRNGDQLTLMTADEMLNASEILAVAHAMRGHLLQLPWPDPHRLGELHIIAP